MQATEDSDDGIQSLLDFIILDGFKSFLELVISVQGDIVRCLIAFIHEVLKCHISSLLEPHVISECLRDDAINLSFEGKQLGGE